MTATAQFWDELAERYAKQPWPNPDSTRRKLVIVRSHLDSQSVVVDIGCGTGTIALELAPHAARVHGIDVSGEMVRIAREKAAAQNAANVDFQQSAVETGLSSFEPGSVDVALAFNILHLTEDWRGVLRQVSTLLKRDGIFVSSTPCVGNSLVPFGPILAVMRWLGKAPRVVVLHTNALIEAMHESGFTDITQPDVGANKTTAFVVAKRT